MSSRVTDELIEDIQKYARAISNSDDKYMDYAQDAMLRIVEKEHDYDPSSAATFNTWATRIAINSIINSIRTETRELNRNLDWAEQNYPDTHDRLQQWLAAERAERDSTSPLPIETTSTDLRFQNTSKNEEAA